MAIAARRCRDADSTCSAVEPRVARAPDDVVDVEERRGDRAPTPTTSTTTTAPAIADEPQPAAPFGPRRAAIHRCRRRGSTGADAAGCVGAASRRRAAAWSSCSRRVLEADQAQLGLERDPAGLADPAPHLAHQPRTRRRRWRPARPGRSWRASRDTTAPPTRRPLRPAASMSRPAESPGGLRNTEPAFGAAGLVLAAPAHDLVDACARTPRPAAAADREVGAGHDLGGTERRVAVAEAEVGRSRAPPRAPEPARSTRRAPARAPRRSRARGPPAFMRTAPPTLPGMPTKNSRPDRPAAAVRRASTGQRDRAARPAPCPAPVVEVDAARSRPPSTTATPANPWSATRRFDPRPTTSTGGACSRDHPGDGGERVERPTRTSAATGPPRWYVVSDGERHVALDRARERALQFDRDRLAGVHRVHASSASHSSGTVVRSPAPSVSTTSPGRASCGTCATRSARRGR